MLPKSTLLLPIMTMLFFFVFLLRDSYIRAGMSGHGHHVKQKKGARPHFDRHKNEERSRQQTVNKENKLLENSQEHSAESSSSRCTSTQCYHCNGRN